MIEKFISTLFCSRSQAHIYHLQTTSYAEHVALQAYYEGIVDMIDSIVEAYQGKHGIIKNYTAPGKFENYGDKNVVNYFKGLAIFCEKAYDKLPADSYLQNLYDGVIELIYSTVYKLENLK
jgi:hypothetical protein